MKNWWTKEEREFLINNYEKQGAQWVANKLGRSINTVRKNAQLLELSFKKIPFKYEKENFEKTVLKSKNIRDCLRNLGMTLTGNNGETIKKYIGKYNINIDHFVVDKSFKTVINLNDVLVENSTYNHTSNLKDRLYKEGLKQRCCELCGQGEEWRGQKMSLILDHINGKNNDNRLENLRIVCPNCNATLSTHCGKNKGKINLKKIENGFDINDNVNFNKIQTKEKIKAQYNRRKVKNRPDKDVLIKEVQELGYSATGRKYGVSDNAIRKWIK